LNVIAVLVAAHANVTGEGLIVSVGLVATTSTLVAVAVADAVPVA
jgi:hypothetical protein